MVICYIAVGQYQHCCLRRFLSPLLGTTVQFSKAASTFISNMLKRNQSMNTFVPDFPCSTSGLCGLSLCIVLPCPSSLLYSVPLCECTILYLAYLLFKEDLLSVFKVCCSEHSFPHTITIGLCPHMVFLCMHTLQVSLPLYKTQGLLV